MANISHLGPSPAPACNSQHSSQKYFWDILHRAFMVIDLQLLQECGCGGRGWVVWGEGGRGDGVHSVRLYSYNICASFCLLYILHSRIENDFWFFSSHTEFEEQYEQEFGLSLDSRKNSASRELKKLQQQQQQKTKNGFRMTMPMHETKISVWRHDGEELAHSYE